MINIKCVASKGAVIPEYKTSGAAGADICAVYTGTYLKIITFDTNMSRPLQGGSFDVTIFYYSKTTLS